MSEEFDVPYVQDVKCNDFLEDIWYNEKTRKFQEKLLSCKRDCPIYKI